MGEAPPRPLAPPPPPPLRRARLIEGSRLRRPLPRPRAEEAPLPAAPEVDGVPPAAEGEGEEARLVVAEERAPGAVLLPPAELPAAWPPPLLLAAKSADRDSCGRRGERLPTTCAATAEIRLVPDVRGVEGDARRSGAEAPPRAVDREGFDVVGVRGGVRGGSSADAAEGERDGFAAAVPPFEERPSPEVRRGRRRGERQRRRRRRRRRRGAPGCRTACARAA